MVKTIVVIGSRKYRDMWKVLEVLLRDVFPGNLLKDTVIMSGKCPMLDSVDNWVVDFAQISNYYTLEVPARKNRKEEYFKRNLIMAHYADEIVAFIPRGQLKSGAWNCISEFKKLGKTDYRVFDENGDQWDRK